ncbi:uncharacterized protein LOC127881302 [Dreissena polymorpha]|uniref:uncharacterized protein LOC127881302 n=1 Tax=Dreissena polymorpha TaxID=45954 RepID=UPI002264E208|nr:uncharacterized protein LOC127881302 [Dreissena polymorpha]
MEDYIYDSDQDLFETPPALLADTLQPAQDFLFFFEETSELDLSDSNTPVGQSSPPPQEVIVISDSDSEETDFEDHNVSPVFKRRRCNVLVQSSSSKVRDSSCQTELEALT